MDRDLKPVEGYVYQLALIFTVVAMNEISLNKKITLVNPFQNGEALHTFAVTPFYISQFY